MTGARLGRPWVVVAVGYGLLLLALLATHRWDPEFFATTGPEWRRHHGEEDRGADGAIYLEIARDPRAAAQRQNSKRLSRILFPALAWAAALGQPALVPWTLVLVNWAAAVLGTELMHRLLVRQGVSPWMALGYGGWVGVGLPVLRDTAEPVTYLAALAGIWWWEQGRGGLARGAFLAALLGRETALLMVGPYLLANPPGRRGVTGPVAGLAVIGAWGGGFMALRVLQGDGGSPPAPPMLPLLGFAATQPRDLAPTVLLLILPAVAVVGLGARALWQRSGDPGLWAAMLNAVLVLSLPPRTAVGFGHSGRLATGFVASTLLAAPLRARAPRVWPALAWLFAGSALWTVAVAARYLLWGTVTLPGGVAPGRMP